MKFSAPLPLSDALKLARDRGLAPTNLTSAQLAEWDDEIKRLSVFSARTNHAGYLQQIKDEVQALLGGQYNEANARAYLQDKLEALNYNPERGGFPGLEDPNIPPAEPGSLRDLSSNKRTQLVLRTQMRQLANRGYLAQGTTPAALFSFPAWELVRIYPRTVPRDDWPDRWLAAGGVLYPVSLSAEASREGGSTQLSDGRGRMIAAKDDPVWEQLGSRDLFDDGIGTPYPPFAFNSGMGWRQIARAICEQLGVPFNKSSSSASSPTPPRLDDVQLSAKFDPEFLKALRAGLDLEIKEGVARLKPGAR